jgi:DNA-binding NtrC family response regulator
VDVRVISATDADLEADARGFRAALRHRLGACEIHLPALREHPQDIGELLFYFLARSAAENERTGLLPHAGAAAPDIAAWALLFHTFLEYPWPGNARELQNFAQQVVLSSGDKPDINASLRAAFDARKRGEPIASRHRLQDVDNETFDRAMAANDFEVKRVARHLGVSRASVYRRIASSPHYRLANAVSARELRDALAEQGGDAAAVARALRVPLNSLRSRLRELDLNGY